MLSLFIFHGLVLIVSSFFLVRYSDIRTLGVTFFISLFIEFFASLLLLSFVSSTSASCIVHVGSFSLHPFFFNAPIIFVFDELTGVFYSILFVALSVCLIFLFQYFEYDFYGATIVLLSFLFSQLALLFFCAYDLLTIIFF